MSAPPKSKQLTVELSAEAEWFAPILLQLNDFMNSVTSGLQTSLTRAQNFASQRYVLDVTTSGTVAASFPFTFNCTLSAAPECITLAQAIIITKGGSFSGTVGVAHWELVAGNQIKIHEITGMNPDTQYRFILLVS